MFKKPEATYLPAYCDRLITRGAGFPSLSTSSSQASAYHSPSSMSAPFRNLLLATDVADAGELNHAAEDAEIPTDVTPNTNKDNSEADRPADSGGKENNSSPAGGGEEPSGTPTRTQTEAAILILPGGSQVKLRVLNESVRNQGTTVLDVRTLYNDHRVLCFDPGFNSTCSCASAITYIDGHRGICLYRGYPVHELIKRVNFLEVCFLLLYGDLPSPGARELFERQVKDEMLLHNRLCDFIQTFVPGAHPMSILASVVSAFASFYADPMSVDHINSWEQRELACIRLLAKMPTVVAMAYKTLIGEPPVYPRADLSYAENFLHMMFATPLEPYKVSALHARIIDTFLTIHADHEQNASTSTVRTAGSSMANPYACIATGITSLWGRAHGGANEAVIRMLQEIGSVHGIPAFVQRVKDKQVRLMGFGHRIYRNYDPRAKLMRDLCYELKANGEADNLFELALELEQVATKDEYFVRRRLYPNVDFYSGVVMRALKVPPEMFTAMFALGRCVGWLSHWKEMVQEGQMKIARPRQLYLGEKERHVVSGSAVDVNRLYDVQAARELEHRRSLN